MTEFQIGSDTFSNHRILVVGDIMLDRYLWGDIKRISPEAPVPVFHIRKRSEILGGAGNVVSNLSGLGCSVTVIGFCGKDQAGERLRSLLDRNNIKNRLLKQNDRPTITKTRVVAKGQQMLRLDDEDPAPLEYQSGEMLLASVKECLVDSDAVILSDYGKGVFQEHDLCQSIIRLARSCGIPVFVDPKGKDWERYRGATCVTPNHMELELVYGETIVGEAELVEAMQVTLSRYDLSWLLTTRGAQGMRLVNKSDPPMFISALAREVFDVSGAGDTVISTLASGVAAGMTFSQAANLANLAAGIVVGKLGTQPINISELEASYARSKDGLSGDFSNKIMSLSSANIQIQAWKANGEITVFTNGCFDLLHPGHIHLLNQAKALGARLIVGLNSDASVKRLKGTSRPILSEHDRASILAALDSVDMVLIFDEDTPEHLIKTLEPDILAKGSDYRMDEVVGRQIVESYGGQVCLLPLLQGYSTTNIAKKVLENHTATKPMQ